MWCFVLKKWQKAGIIFGLGLTLVFSQGILFSQVKAEDPAAGASTKDVLGEDFTNYNQDTQIGENNDDIVAVFKKFLTWAMGFAAVLAVGFIIYGGYTYILAGGNDENIKKGKNMVMKAIIGLIIILAAWLIITTIVGLLQGNKNESQSTQGLDERGNSSYTDLDTMPTGG